MFFSVTLKRDGTRLTWSMSGPLRFGLSFALLSVLAMIVFSLTAAEYAALRPIGKVNVVLFPVLLLLGVLYDYRIVFDKAEGTVTIKSGVVFAARRRVLPLDAVQKLVVRSVSPGKRAPNEVEPGGGLRRGRVFIGFVIGGRLIVLDRACSVKKARSWVLAFRSFMPFSVEEGE